MKKIIPILEIYALAHEKRTDQFLEDLDYVFKHGGLPDAFGTEDS